MSADQLLCQISQNTPDDEWFDFNNSFDIPSGCLDSNATSVDSISPRDLDLAFPDLGECNWGTTPTACPDNLFSEFVSYDASYEAYPGLALDNSHIDLTANDAIQSIPTLSDQELARIAFDDAWSQEATYPEDPFYVSIRQMVEAQALADSGCSTIKEKRRDASIAIHLQRLQEAASSDSVPSTSSTTFPSPCWSGSAQNSIGSCATPVTGSPPDTNEKSQVTTAQASPTNGAMELVLDLNMNTTTNVPKKQKPRSRAQKESYIKVRKYGACEKHRKQHKRCNCLEKTAALSIANDSFASFTNAVAKSSAINSQLYVPGRGNERHPSWKHTSTPTLQPTGLQGSVQETARSRVQLPHALCSSKASVLVTQPAQQLRPTTQQPARPSTTGQLDSLLRRPPQSTILRRPGDQTVVTMNRKHFQSDGGAIRTSRTHCQLTGTLYVDQDLQTHTQRSPSLKVPRGVVANGSCDQTRRKTHVNLQSVESACETTRTPLQRSKRGTSDTQPRETQLQTFARNTGTLVLHNVSAFTRFFDFGKMFASWLGSSFGKLAVSTTRKHWLARKEMGLW
ncbi:uncharacterized protein BO97DRAFT_479322 [Aspergillus homomorphus CBS 101889]|uniref:Uncharacterized protein n=1 Tax=Aspergillus homomorphus (strain CBS 101889) TaxID=1450537 RepID=A0A395HS80_ASPHC|nr:hypothetical protein BO97DRAFT_479322 [Aspergillus homomorphus CBS 101889]RAL10273.1 hypothetical protein BO97DRAFT_479322 [Aspergillus homomorphus CBS 101889]